MDNAFESRLNGGSTEAQRKLKCTKVICLEMERTFEPRFNGGSTKAKMHKKNTFRNGKRVGA